MQGRCLSCSRSYEISDDFLSMGGKAKCPHCLQELSFQDENARTVVENPTQVSSPSHGTFDSPNQKADKTRTIITDDIGQNVVKVNDPYVGTGDFDLPELNELQSQQDPSAPTDSDDEFTGVSTDPFQDRDEIQTQTGRDPTQESPPDEDDDYFQDITRRVDSLQLPDADHLASGFDPVHDSDDESSLPEELSDDQDESDLEEEFGSDSEEEFGSDSEEEFGSDSEEEFDPDEALSMPELEENHSQTDHRSEAEESFDSSLYDSNEVSQNSTQASGNWALAAEEWAKGGFRADQMPDFISKERQSKTASQEIESDPTGEDSAQTDSVSRQTDLKKKPKEESTVIVSEQDVIGLFDQKNQVAQDSRPKEAKPVGKKTFQKLNTEKIRSRKLSDTPISKLLSRPRLLAIAVLIIVFFLWILFRQENISSFEFPMQGIAANQIESPEPRQYQAKENAIKHYAKGNHQAYIGKFENAINEYQQAIQLDSSYPLPHRALGSIYAALGKASLSISFYDSYLRLAPDTPDAVHVKSIISTYNAIE